LAICSQLDLKPPTFRESGFSRISGSTRDATLTSYGSILHLIINASPPHDPTYLASHPNTPSHETSASPFWKLLLLFEALIFQPLSSVKTMNTNIQCHLKPLTTGHIEDLHAEMMEHPHSKSTTYARQADVDEWNEVHFLPFTPSNQVLPESNLKSRD
jgi:hypothetical protein